MPVSASKRVTKSQSVSSYCVQYTRFGYSLSSNQWAPMPASVSTVVTIWSIRWCWKMRERRLKFSSHRRGTIRIRYCVRL